MRPFLLATALALSLSSSPWTLTPSSMSVALSVAIDDAFVPETCENIAEPGDHLLVEYELTLKDGTVAASLKAPAPRLYVHLSSHDDATASPVIKGLKGVCKNATRVFRWDSAVGVDMSPVFAADTGPARLDVPVSLAVRVVHLTPQKDYHIFSVLKNGNLSHAMAIIDGHHGVNAVDEWGQTPLMIAMQRPRELLPVVAFLMNTRRPMVDVNMAKASGHTALFYAIEFGVPVEILTALLRRGADPNAASVAEGSRGNTPLHYACFLEKIRHAEALLEYGANPHAVNEHGQQPHHLLPTTVLPATKLRFQQVFNEAAQRLSTQLGSPSSSSSSQFGEL